MIKLPISEMDVVFISYDEPQMEDNWSDLLTKAPYALRVHGVKGFDAAHKAAAAVAQTDRFITVDADSIVDETFFDRDLLIPDEYRKHIFSWAGTNVVNGLVYGNGSLKCWVRDTVFSMKTHEDAVSEQNKIEFCWGLPYLSMQDSYSTTNPAATPFHAFRAGFREGIKMCLERGKRLDPKDVMTSIWPGNAHKLRTWMSVGADTPNGLWCIYGTRLAMSRLTNIDWDFSVVSDYAWFESLWSEFVQPMHEAARVDFNNDAHIHLRQCPETGWGWHRSALEKQIRSMGIEWAYQENVPVLDQWSSAFYKMMVTHQERETPRIVS